MSNKVTIVAHNGGFHADDIFAVATLKIVLKDKEVEIIRSRDAEVINKADYVVDVGGVYDSKINRFDHHQEGGAGKRDNGIPYASFGLVWKEYGIKICPNQKVVNKIDKLMVQPIDANDNAVQFLETKIKDLHPFDTGFINYIFNPTWKEDPNTDDTFMKVVSYAEFFLSRAIVQISDSVEAESLVLESYNKSLNKKIIEVNGRHPWEEVLLQFPEPLWAIYKKADGNWSMKRVPLDSFSYEPRKRLPESWAGKTGEDLEKITGVSGAVFCHNGRFFAVAKTKEAILKMAEIALNS